jgi:hypothetical protein
MYARTFVADYAEMQHRVITQLLAAPDQGTDEEIAERSEVPSLLTLHIMKLLNMNGLPGLSESLGPWTYYLDASPKPRRLLD